MAIRDRTRRANGRLRFHLCAAFAIGAALAFIVAAQALLLGWRDAKQIGTLALLYGGSGFVGTFAGSWLATWFTHRPAGAFAAWAMLSGGLSMGGGAFLFALTYRAAYAQWHEAAFTVAWAFQGFFTMAGAVYYWAVLGTRMILPWAIVPLALGALAFARRVR